jgi:hypothetical protein
LKTLIKFFIPLFVLVTSCTKTREQELKEIIHLNTGEKISFEQFKKVKKIKVINNKYYLSFFIYHDNVAYGIPYTEEITTSFDNDKKLKKVYDTIPVYLKSKPHQNPHNHRYKHIVPTSITYNHKDFTIKACEYSSCNDYKLEHIIFKKNNEIFICNPKGEYNHVNIYINDLSIIEKLLKDIYISWSKK